MNDISRAFLRNRSTCSNRSWIDQFCWLPGLNRFVQNGQLEMDTNAVENQIRRVALTRKNALFAGNDVGAEHWAMLASLVATCKMSDVNPVDYIAETLRAILDGHPQSRIEELMPWNFRKTSSRAA